MIAVVTTDKEGGTVQLAGQIYRSLRQNGADALLFAPQDTALDGDLPVRRFQMGQTIPEKLRCADAIAETILAARPTEVWCTDETTVSQQLLLRLAGKCRTVAFLHDVSPHPARFRLRAALRNRSLLLRRRRVLKRVDRIILLSNATREKFEKCYPAAAEKVALLPLGAHVPHAGPVRPPELVGLDRGYFLFFGRIDRYKNLSLLLDAYRDFPKKDRFALVVAGFGALSEGERSRIDALGGDVFLLNRFLSDGEMCDLFTHARAIVLPYLEASQSGVLSMGMYFGLPAIVSDLPGLTEFLSDGEPNGWVCRTAADFTNAMTALTDDEVFRRTGDASLRFYRERLDFDRNVGRLLDMTPGEQN